MHDKVMDAEAGEDLAGAIDRHSGGIGREIGEPRRARRTTDDEPECGRRPSMPVMLPDTSI